MTIIIDNHDSFTYNLVHAVASIAGRMPLVFRNDEITWEQLCELEADNFIISPGPGHPDRPRDFGVSADVIRYAAVPVLGVCLGHQGIASAFGGRVEQGEPVHGRTAEIAHGGDPLFKGLPDRFQAVRYHSLVVREPLPPELRKLAWLADGTVMALRHSSRPLWGVQFHPESILTEYGHELLANFLRAKAEKPENLTTARSIELPPPAAERYQGRPEQVFRELFASEANSFWLDGPAWFRGAGVSLMGTGTVERHTFDSLADALRKNIGLSAGGYFGYITYEGEAVLIRPSRCVAVEHSGDQAVMTPRAPALVRNIRYSIPRDRYLGKIRQCLEWIREGESYELCLTNKLLLQTDLPALDYFESLRRTNRAPYAAYLRTGETEIACSSPECFLHIDPTGRVESRPIKGTLAREYDPDQLIRNERYRAENLMIVDLVRHDLSRVCEVGSVRVPGLMEVETYPALHQLVSTIEGQLRPNATAIDCIRAAFPGGSMTGAPKERAMELLQSLENAPRGIYSGSLGYLGFDGTVDLNIVIRTAVFHQGEVSIGTGGAIVAQSDPKEEWAELELKTRMLLRAFTPGE